MSYDEQLQELLDKLTTEIETKDFDTLHFQLDVWSTSVGQRLVYWRKGRRIAGDALGDEWFGYKVMEMALALRKASNDEGLGDFQLMTLTVQRDGKFDLEFTPPEMVATSTNDANPY